jgi:hypothetical protein
LPTAIFFRLAALVRPEIFERLTVVLLNIRGHRFLNSIRHHGLLRRKRPTCLRVGSAASCPRA